MRILFSAEDLWPYVGGAEVGLDELLAELSKEHEVHAVWVGEKKKADSPYHQHPQNPSIVYKNIPLFNRTLFRHYYANLRWERLIGNYIDTIQPDLILTQLQFMPGTIRAAVKHNVKTASFIQNWEHFCPYLFMNHDPADCLKKCFSFLPAAYRAQWPIVERIRKAHAWGFQHTDLVFGDSQYCCDVLKMFYGVEGVPFHPVIHLDKFKITENSKEFVTFINPIKTKGIMTLLPLVRLMPNTKFLVVGGGNVTAKPWIEKIRKEKNVTYIPWESDMRKVYARTRTLIVPSTWPEPFGRIVLEAAINGIPTIASARGGLPEAVGKGGLLVSDHLNPAAWKSAIEEAERRYGELSKEARLQGVNFDYAHQMKYFSAKMREKGLL